MCFKIELLIKWEIRIGEINFGCLWNFSPGNSFYQWRRERVKVGKEERVWIEEEEGDKGARSIFY